LESLLALVRVLRSIDGERGDALLAEPPPVLVLEEDPRDGHQRQYGLDYGRPSSPRQERGRPGNERQADKDPVHAVHETAGTVVEVVHQPGAREFLADPEQGVRRPLDEVHQARPEVHSSPFRGSNRMTRRLFSAVAIRSSSPRVGSFVALSTPEMLGCLVPARSASWPCVSPSEFRRSKTCWAIS